MANLTRDLFIGLSNNQFLNANAKKWGFRLGADKFVAGTDIDSVVNVVKELNQAGISCTLDNLGEFVFDKSEATQAKEDILEMIEKIHAEQLDCHVSVKMTQLGLDIEQDFCINNMSEILATAAKYDIFVNIDMEKYEHYQKTLDVMAILRRDFNNVGTVLQSYLYRTVDDLEDLKDVRLRLVKGAYKESEEVAFQTQDEIDANFIKACEIRLLGDTFTSIATHDHNIINYLKKFAKENNVPKDNYEFQMLYGFRVEMQHELAEEGYNFCTYIPFGNDWFGYFMRRLAERPQNLQLVMKDTFYTKDSKLKKSPIIAGGALIGLFALWRMKKKKGK